ncbi:hypothetical protein BGHDH14_bgh01922 [Blumeria hordei DH14]|uniref:Cytochrome c oxidase assembly factor 6 n=1 Tax=Blumeria graminis f. sp. hordei (strain DH14) TaxID=546991 RepID=N1JAK9_BLUG1|nr:hypothetical protein BGHDH14_bgh01922 [Blumeria hordei DH14]
MGLLGYFDQSSVKPKLASDGAPIAPDRSQRAKCWEARDAFFECLDRHNIIDSIRDKDKVEEVCRREEKPFQLQCASSWQRRVAEWKKARTIEKLTAEGAQPLSGELPAPPIQKS